MSEIKALDKLRVSSADASVFQWIREDYRNRIADEIEAEIAGNYMRLPCDADGVPIHVGDKLVKNGEVIGNVTAVGFHDEPRVWVLPDGTSLSISFLAEGVKHHHAPHTLEDVLRDVWKEALDYAKSDIWRSPDEAIAERAAEIRELLGEGEVIDGGLIADALAPVCVDEKERRAFERGRVHERFAQQIFKEATS